MNKTTMSIIFLFIGVNSFAGVPSATLCRAEAINGAIAIFNLNNKEKGDLSVSTELVSMDHSEGGVEVWDVKFEKKNIKYSPYRMSVVIDGCIITGFSMPFGG